MKQIFFPPEFGLVVESLVENDGTGGTVPPDESDGGWESEEWK